MVTAAGWWQSFQMKKIVSGADILKRRSHGKYQGKNAGGH